MQLHFLFRMRTAGQLKSLEGYRLYTAMYEFTARSDDELSLNPGDMVWVCDLSVAHICNILTKKLTNYQSYICSNYAMLKFVLALFCLKSVFFPIYIISTNLCRTNSSCIAFNSLVDHPQSDMICNFGPVCLSVCLSVTLLVGSFDP